MKVILEKVPLLKIIFIIFFLSFNKNLTANDKSLSFDGTDDFVEIVKNPSQFLQQEFNVVLSDNEIYFTFVIIMLFIVGLLFDLRFGFTWAWKIRWKK